VLVLVDFKVDKNVVRNSGLVSVACMADSKAARISGEISAILKQWRSAGARLGRWVELEVNESRKRGNQIKKTLHMYPSQTTFSYRPKIFTFSITTPIAMFYASFPAIPAEKGFFP
jgi:hypothetical protein